MKRVLVVLLSVGIVAGLTSAVQARGRFQVRCQSSHVATVDPITAPGQPSFHEHEFFGNRTTDADSTYSSMLQGATTCSTTDDTAGYWTPTLFRPDDTRVRAKSLLIYYRAPSNGGHVEPFPRDLRMISDRMTIGPNTGNLIVEFPSCNDGRLDSWDHRSHMAFPDKGCPASHPIRVPFIVEVFRYPVQSVQGFHLSSGGLETGHADFWNTWDQPALVALVDRCLNAELECGRIDS